MKKAAIALLVLFFAGILSACVPTEHMNILLFTDELSAVSETGIELSDYTVCDGEYELLFENEGFFALLTATENEKGEIKKVRLTFSKTDEKGNITAPTPLQAEYFRQKACQMLSAFTLFEEEKSRELTEKILPLKSEDFLKAGELTMEADNFHLVYYSNKICCQFTVTNTFLKKTEITEKPVSRPLYEVTANITD